jgi:hypothetical protein
VPTVPPNDHSSDTTVTLNITAVPAGSYKVISPWSAGSFCNATVIVK